MRILLDECLPRKLKNSLPGHDVETVPKMGWAGVKNGALLRRMEPLFDVFITMDGNLEYQQNLPNVKMGFIVLAAVDNKIETLLPLAPDILAALEAIENGDIVRVTADCSLHL